MQGSISGVEIRGIESAVPANTVDNEELAKNLGDKRATKQVRLTGIRHRHVTTGGQTATDLATVAGERLLSKLEWNRDEIRVLIYVTQSGDLNRPGSAFLIQKRLGIGKQCLIFDINQGCAGYVIGLSVIGSLLSQNGGKGLLFVGESNAIEDNTDNHNAMLDGDAAAATALEYTGSEVELRFRHDGDGERAKLLFCRHDGRGRMDGNAVLLFGLSDVAAMIHEFLTEEDENEIDCFVLHQAQKMIVEGVVQEAGIPRDRVIQSCEEYGNTSSASIPLTLCVHQEKLQGKERLKVFMCGFGIGLSWGCVQTEIRSDAIGDVTLSDYIYDDRDEFKI